MRTFMKSTPQSTRPVSLTALIFILCGLSVSGAVSADAGSRVVLNGHISGAVASARALGRESANRTISFAITLPLRNQSELQNLLRGLYDPNDPRYGLYLTPEQ